MDEAEFLCGDTRRFRLFGGGVGTVVCELGENHVRNGERHEGKDSENVTHKWGV